MLISAGENGKLFVIVRDPFYLKSTCCGL